MLEWHIDCYILVFVVLVNVQLQYLCFEMVQYVIHCFTNANKFTYLKTEYEAVYSF